MDQKIRGLDLNGDCNDSKNLRFSDLGASGASWHYKNIVGIYNTYFAIFNDMIVSYPNRARTS